MTYNFITLLIFIAILLVSSLIILCNYPKEWMAERKTKVILAILHLMISATAIITIFVTELNLRQIGFIVGLWSVGTALVLIIRGILRFLIRAFPEGHTEQVFSVMYSHLAGILVVILCYNYLPT